MNGLEKMKLAKQKAQEEPKKMETETTDGPLKIKAVKYYYSSTFINLISAWNVK